jgi:hypothetical protein
MRIILGVLAPDAGEVRWRGQPMNDEIHKQIGYLPEDHGQTFHDGSLLIASSRLIAVTGVARRSRTCRAAAVTGLDALVLSVVVVEPAAPAGLRRSVVVSGSSVTAPEGDAEGGQGAVARRARTTG